MNTVKHVLSNIKKIEYGFIKEPAGHGCSKGYTLFDYIDELNNAKTVESIQETCVRIRNGYGFKHFGLGVLIPRLNEVPMFIHIFDYMSDWQTFYDKNNFLLIDPLTQQSLVKSTPYIWQGNYNIEHESFFTKENIYFFNCAQDFNMTYCFQFPWMGTQGEMGGIRFSSFNNSKKNNKKYIMKILPDLNLLSAHIHESVLKVVKNKFDLKLDISLTAREKEVLSWSAHGKSIYDLSIMLKLSETTVISHLKNSYKKLGVKSKHHAIAKAVNLKVILL